MDFLIKGLGSVFIVASTTLLGVYSSVELKNRREALSWYVGAVSEIREKVRATSAELCKILTGLYGSEKYFTVEAPFKVRIKKGALKERDEKIINEFFGGFGMGDTDSQIARCDMYLALLQKNYEEAAREFGEKSKLYKQLGFFAGLSVAVMVV